MKSVRSQWNDAVGDAPWASVLAPAPGELCIVQALVNTVDHRRRTDELRTPRALADWLQRWRLWGDSAELGDAELERALAVREGLRTLVAGNARQKVDAAALERLDQAMAKPTIRVRFAAGTPQLEVAVGGFEGALGHLGRIVARANQEGVWRRLKVCRGEVCGWAFYDSSPNAKRKWCSMQRCGNRVKARTFRQRHDTHLRKPAVQRRGRRAQG